MYEPFIHRKVHDRFYVIAEMHNIFPKDEITNPVHTCTMGLVIGDEKAALIDTGTGIGNIKEYVSRMTSLSVIVLNTHAHLDHVGANSLFEKSYFSKKDEWLLKKNTMEERLGFLRVILENDQEKIEYAEKNIIGDTPINYEYIDDGDVIDLGGVQLEALEFPGHTNGSLAFVDRRDRVAFCGDSILHKVLLNLEDNQPVHRYVNSMKRFFEKTAGIDEIIPGHQFESLHKTDAYELKRCASDIVNGAPGKPVFYLGQESHIHQYGKKRIVF